MSTDKMYRLLLSSAAIFIPVWTVKLSAERVGVAQCVEIASLVPDSGQFEYSDPDPRPY